MADKLKPYDPNKGFISFKLDPDYIVDQLGNLIPYRNTIGMIDSESPWSEVGKSALNETPVLGRLLAGEPLDAAEEAFLLGLRGPANGLAHNTPRVKKDISKNPGREYFNYGGNLYYKDNKGNYVNAYDHTDKYKPSDKPLFESKQAKAYKYTNDNQVLNDIDMTQDIYFNKLTSDPFHEGLIDRTRKVKNMEDAINTVNDFKKSHRIPKNNEVYANHVQVLVWDPVKQVGNIYSDYSGNFGPSNRVWGSTPQTVGSNFFNGSSMNAFHKVDKSSKGKMDLERKNLISEANQFNNQYEYQAIGEFEPMNINNIIQYKKVNNDNFR